MTRTPGRVGVTSGGLPVIFPVRYLFAENAITFRTGGGTKLRAAESGDVLAFQVDAYDTETNEGWSVLVLGRATQGLEAGLEAVRQDQGVCEIEKVGRDAVGKLMLLPDGKPPLERRDRGVDVALQDLAVSKERVGQREARRVADLASHAEPLGG